ncbi:hypothetical protein O9992_11560 [Vibrio lentus]|nr:hypothetical protein [Vibrio lentus]
MRLDAHMANVRTVFEDLVRLIEGANGASHFSGIVGPWLAKPDADTDNRTRYCNRSPYKCKNGYPVPKLTA